MAGWTRCLTARGQQQQLSLHLEHEFLHSHDGHAQEVHPHDLHVVASGHAHLSGPRASQSFGEHAIVANRSEVRRGMAKRGVPSDLHAKVAAQTEYLLAHVTCIYLRVEMQNILDTDDHMKPPPRKYFLETVRTQHPGDTQFYVLSGLFAIFQLRQLPKIPTTL